jgi:hypothetical protein
MRADNCRATRYVDTCPSGVISGEPMLLLIAATYSTLTAYSRVTRADEQGYISIFRRLQPRCLSNAGI